MFTITNLNLRKQLAETNVLYAGHSCHSLIIAHMPCQIDYLIENPVHDAKKNFNITMLIINHVAPISTSVDAHDDNRTLKVRTCRKYTAIFQPYAAYTIFSGISSFPSSSPFAYAARLHGCLYRDVWIA